jgi:hypothetical protein
LIGYVAAKQNGFGDYHIWHATALEVEYHPAGSTNETLTAFAFEVSHNGTFLDGPAVAARVYKTIIETAEGLCQPLTLNPQQIAHTRKIPIGLKRPVQNP